MASSPITSWQIDRETVETVADFIFLDSKIAVDGDCNHEIKRCLLLGRKVMTNLDSILKSREYTQWAPRDTHRDSRRERNSLLTLEVRTDSPDGHKGGVICISEVIDISPSNLDSSLCFFQSSVSHDVLCIEVK